MSEERESISKLRQAVLYTAEPVVKCKGQADSHKVVEGDVVGVGNGVGESGDHGEEGQSTQHQEVQREQIWIM